MQRTWSSLTLETTPLNGTVVSRMELFVKRDEKDAVRKMPLKTKRAYETVFEFYPDASGSTRGLRLGLRLVDLAAAIAALGEIGVVLRPGSPLTIDDPDGHRLELHSGSAA